MWLGGDTQVQQETPCDCRQMHEETGEWQRLVDAISLTVKPILFFPCSWQPHGPAAVMGGKTPTSEQACSS